MQSRRVSFIEAIVNVLIGYWIALLSQLLIFPLYGVDLPLSQNAAIGVWFTVISIIRSYTIRRWFNRRIHTFAEWFDRYSFRR